MDKGDFFKTIIWVLSTNVFAESNISIYVGYYNCISHSDGNCFFYARKCITIVDYASVNFFFDRRKYLLCWFDMR